MAFPRQAIDLIIKYCPPHLPFRAASVEVLKVLERSKPFMEYFGVQLMKQKRYEGPDCAHHQLSRAVRIGHSLLVKLLMRFNTDPHIPVRFFGADSYDEEVEIEETPFQTAIRTSNWDAVIAFVAHSLPPHNLSHNCLRSISLSECGRLFRAVPWSRMNKEARAFFQHLKEDCRHREEDARRALEDARHARENARRAREDARRSLEYLRRAKEDARRARCHLRRASTMVKQQQREVEVAAEEEEDEEEDHEDKEQLQQKAMDESETANLLAAIQASKADLPVLSGDNVVLLRITRMARSPLVTEVLLESPLLLHCRERVQDAGCEITPQGACGPKLFVPCTTAQLEELKELGFELLDHHVLALREDKALINQAFKDVLPKRWRPAVSFEHGSAAGQAIQESEGYTHSKNEDDDAMDFVVEESGYATDSDIGFPSYERAGSSGDGISQ